jgi:hypothetical protein
MAAATIGSAHSFVATLRLVPPPRTPSSPWRAGFAGVLDSLLTAQHVFEMYGPPYRMGSRHIGSSR